MWRFFFVSLPLEPLTTSPITYIDWFWCGLRLEWFFKEMGSDCFCGWISKLVLRDRWSMACKLVFVFSEVSWTKGQTWAVWLQSFFKLFSVSKVYILNSTMARIEQGWILWFFCRFPPQPFVCAVMPKLVLLTMAVLLCTCDGVPWINLWYCPALPQNSIGPFRVKSRGTYLDRMPFDTVL